MHLKPNKATGYCLNPSDILNKKCTEQQQSENG